MDLRRKVLAAMSSYPRLSELGSEAYEPRGIFNSEMAAVIALSLAENIDLLVESGRSRGHSTLLLAKHLGAANIAIHSFDRDRDTNAIYSEQKLAGFANLHLHYGDSRLLLPAFVAANRGSRIGLLIDGPKDEKAVALASDCLIAGDGVAVTFIHDTALLGSGKPSAGRAAVERVFEGAFFTDDAEYVAKFRYLDAPVFSATDAGKTHWKPHSNSDREQTSYGPTLAIILPTAEDRLRARKRGMSASAPKRLYWMVKDTLRRAVTKTPALGALARK